MEGNTLKDIIGTIEKNCNVNDRLYIKVTHLNCRIVLMVVM